MTIGWGEGGGSNCLKDKHYDFKATQQKLTKVLINLETVPDKIWSCRGGKEATERRNQGWKSRKVPLGKRRKFLLFPPL